MRINLILNFHIYEILTINNAWKAILILWLKYATLQIMRPLYRVGAPNIVNNNNTLLPALT